MGTEVNDYQATHPGLAGMSEINYSKFRIPPEDEEWAFFASRNDISHMEGKRVLMAIGGRYGYTNGGTRYTETKDAAGGGAATFTFGTGGWRLTTDVDGTANGDFAVNSVEEQASAKDNDIFWTMAARLALNDIDEVGLGIGFGDNGVVELFSDPTDGFYFFVALATGIVLGRVVENGNAAEDTGTLATLTDALEIRLGVKVRFGATAAETYGYWMVNGTKTVFTDQQNADIWTMVATTPTLRAIAGIRAQGGVQGIATFGHCLMEVDR